MAFQPSAFQFNAFQMAIDRVARSGVIRLWLMALTEALNKEVKPSLKVTKKDKVKLQTVVENADGSATIDAVKVEQKKEVPSAKIKLAKPLKRAVTEKEYKKLDLPTPTETAEYLLNTLVLQATNQVWAEEQVLLLLKQALEMQQEEDMILESAIIMLM